MDPDPVEPSSPPPPVTNTNSNAVYETRPLKSKTTIRWKVNDHQLVMNDKSWPALSLSFETRGALGRNYTWRISLAIDEEYLYGRAELISPVEYRIPYIMSFNLENIEHLQQEYDPVPREITSQDAPQKWKICQKKDVPFLITGSNFFEITVEVQCFGSETIQEYEIQNYPY